VIFLDTYTAGSTVYVMFNTHKGDGTPITLGGTPAVSVYKDNGTTESTTGVTLAVDFDSRTGLHNVAIDTSQDETFYATNHSFFVVITTGTVDSVSVVGTMVYRFKLGTVPSNTVSMDADTITASALATDAATEIATTLLKLDLSTVTGESSRSMLNAIRFLRNKWTVVDTTLTVYKEDDTASAWTATITASAGANPITANDPT
jgi:hypothetical protein